MFSTPISTSVTLVAPNAPLRSNAHLQPVSNPFETPIHEEVPSPLNIWGSPRIHGKKRRQLTQGDKDDLKKKL